MASIQVALPPVPDGWLPLVSVVCPVRDERTSIDDVIDALEAQTYPHDRLELLVVDGRSTDGTAERVRERSAHSSLRLRVVDNPRQVTPVALNLGIAESAGEVIVLVGGHTVVGPEFVAASITALAETGAACAGGRMDTVGEGAVARAIALAQSSRAGVGGVTFRTVESGAMSVDTVAYGAYRREVFQQIGGFDEELVRNQDDELNFRLTQAGGLIWFDSRIRSTYRSRATFRRLIRQYHDYGLFKVLVMQKRRGVPAPRHLVPAAAVLALAGSVVGGALLRRPALPMVVVGAYVAGCGVAGSWEGRRDLAAVPLVPPALAALHLPYGVGFLRGLWRFRHRWGDAAAPVRAPEPT